MKTSVPAQLTLFPMPQRDIRGLSFISAIKSGLRPYEYKSVIEASCMEAILDFKIWGKTPCLGCYFRDISTGKKFVLYAHDDCHSRRYTPKDKEFDFSQSGMEGGLFYLVTRKTRTGKTSPKERRQGQGCEAPEGLDLDRAAAFGNVPRLDGPEGRLGNALQGPDKSFSIQGK
ncbi:hypothetical protein [Desulfovibrio sp. ZJ200]|uniref:hypothetical protein n=1 Tax=Desulfovibrio sp. ZJ200 TaxID=2709792 RepID=UPI0013ED3C95|nr:hypothetical protein [Desulfovibrio sp. ZJ200]